MQGDAAAVKEAKPVHVCLGGWACTDVRGYNPKLHGQWEFLPDDFRAFFNPIPLEQLRSQLNVSSTFSLEFPRHRPSFFLITNIRRVYAKIRLSLFLSLSLSLS